MVDKKPAKRAKPERQARKLKQPEYKSFKLHKRIQHPGEKLSSAWSLLKASNRHLYTHKKLFLGLTVIYMLLTIVFVRGFVVTTDLGLAKEAVQELFQGAAGQFAGSLTVFSILLESSGAGTDAAAVYQSIIVIIMSLAAIWALRQTHAGQKISLKDAVYKSSYPLVPFVLVLVVIGLQMVPMFVANFVYKATVSGGIAVSGIEIILWSFLTFLLVLWSLYMVSASAFALYIVTLPDMTPLIALKSARNLVQFRRWVVLRKVLFLPVIIVVIGFAILLPVILFLTPISEIVFLIVSAMVVAFSHSYLYTLYRELL